MERFQEQGRACYKRKEFDRALQLFDRALGRGESVQLYDNRAACHEKLGDLPSALKDAKKAIQLQKEDPTGYLRAGRIFIKMEKHSVALEVYSHGLKSVKHVGHGFELLKEAQKSVMHKVCPPKGVDPLTVLPRELAEQVLNYLSFKQKIAVCRVSRPWTNFIRSMPELWQHIDLSGAKKKVRCAFVSRAINCGRKRITKATLHNLMDLDKTLKALLQHTLLEDLILLDTGLQGSNMVEMLAGAKRLKRVHFGQGTEISQDSLRQLVEASPPALESLTCEDVRIRSNGGIDLQNLRTPRTSLTTFSLRCGVMRLSRAFFGHLPTAMPNLQALTIFETQHKMAAIEPFGLIDLRALTKLQSLSLHSSTVGMSHNLKLPTSLRQLRFCSGRRLAGGFFQNISSPTGGTNSYRLPKLEDLDADIFVESFLDISNFLSEIGTWDETSPTAEQMVEPPSKLRRLTLNWYHNDPNANGLDMLLSHPRLSQLEHFGLHILGSRSSEKIAIILAQLKTLRSMDLSGTQLNGIDVKKIVQSGHIKQIIMNDCPDVPRDAVDWARAQGVDVQCRMNSKSYDDGSRKVRN